MFALHFDTVMRRLWPARLGTRALVLGLALLLGLSQVASLSVGAEPLQPAPPTPPAPSALPDLVVGNVQVVRQTDGCFTWTEPLETGITIVNQGKAAAGRFMVRVDRLYLQVNGLGPGASTVLTVRGLVAFVQADSFYEVLESNEQNNNYEVPAFTPPPLCPTPTPTPTPPPPGAHRAPRPAAFHNGAWTLGLTLSSRTTEAAFDYNVPGSRALMCDWNGDGTRTPGLYRDGVWYLRNPNEEGPPDVTFTFGGVGDFPVCGDWNGDGVETVGVWTGSTWSLRNRNSAGIPDVEFEYGTPLDYPVVGDWDGDGVTTIGIRRTTRYYTAFYLRNSLSNGPSDRTLRFDASGDVVVGDWNGDGRDTLGVVSNGQWILSNADGSPDLVFNFGPTEAVPLIWR